MSTHPISVQQLVSIPSLAPVTYSCVIFVLLEDHVGEAVYNGGRKQYKGGGGATNL